MIRKSLPASFTVEAALVLSLILFALGTVIVYDFRLYDKVLGDAVLNELTERYGHLPEAEKDSGTSLSEYGGRLLESRFSRGGISVEEYRNGSRGTVRNRASETEMTDKGFRPEKIMRSITLIEEIAGSEN